MILMNRAWVPDVPLDAFIYIYIYMICHFFTRKSNDCNFLLLEAHIRSSKRFENSPKDSSASVKSKI